MDVIGALFTALFTRFSTLYCSPAMLTPHQDHLNAQRIVLGSSSPQRQRILKDNLGLAFEVIPSEFQEDLDKKTFKTTEDYVMATCRGKYDDLMENKLDEPPFLLICADTVVALKEDGEEKEHILEKATDREHAMSMIRKLSGRNHRIVTAVNFKLKDQAEICSFVEITNVEFVQIPELAIEKYVDSGEAFGKAGAYGIQGLGSSFVKCIEGDYYNAVGFPSHRFAMELSLRLP